MRPAAARELAAAETAHTEALRSYGSARAMEDGPRVAAAESHLEELQAEVNRARAHYDRMGRSEDH